MIVPAVLLALLGCAMEPSGGRLSIATITSSNTFGGEALFTGKLLVRGGCLVAAANDRFATPIFDPGVTLALDGSSIRDVAQSAEVPIGRPFRAGAAWMRDDGEGWPISDILAFFGTRIPPGCPTDDVIRLHGFQLSGEE